MNKKMNPYFVLYTFTLAIAIALSFIGSMPWPTVFILADIGAWMIIVYGVTYIPYQESTITWHTHTSTK